MSGGCESGQATPVKHLAQDLIPALAATTGGRARFAFRPAPPGPLPDVGELLAGAAEADLTPPPGLPKAGYSRNARTGTGFRTRLRARVVHLRCGTSSLAVVATDLLGGSAVLQHLVAARVAEVTDVPLAGLFVGATHTHGGPGQFHGTDFYNRFSANRPGFDPAWTAVLAERIAAAVVRAVESRVPAAAAWGRVEVPGVARNRSLPAYRRNPGRETSEAATAVNPWLELLRVDTLAADGGTDPLAALAIFSIHGTAVPMTSQTYNADLWAYLYDELGDRVAASHGRRPVTGALQGTHGDVTPALERPAGHPEAARLGREIGVAAATLYASLDGELDRRPALGCGFREIDLEAPPGDAPAGVGIRLPRRPAVGAALVAGAMENLTPGIAAIPLIRAGAGKRIGGYGPHGESWVLGSRWLQPIVLPLAGFPRVLPVHVVRIGGVLVAGLPMEITTESGRRIAAGAAAAWQAAGGEPVRAVVSSVVDEYAGYCTTSQEYGAQFYEGGHTLYGPATQRFLAAHVGLLAARVARERTVHEALPQRPFDLAVRRYLPAATSRPVTARSAARPVLRPPDVAAGREWLVEWEWEDAAPGDLPWHERLVQVETLDGGTWSPLRLPGGAVLDDGRGELEVVHLGPAHQGGTHRYAVRWYRDLSGDPSGGWASGDEPARFALAAGPTSPTLF
jgi:neutral ceramidase